MKLFELRLPEEIIELDKQLDQMFRPLGLNVVLSRHFKSRILNREQRVTIEMVTSAFEKLKRKFKKRLIAAKKRPAGDYEAILKDFSQELVIIFGIRQDNLNAITLKTIDPNQFGSDNKGGDILKV